jgi:mono/diheme cytochrome c family protein
MKYIIPLFILLFAMSAFAPAGDDLEASKARGSEAYFLYCVSCHMGEGEGVKGAVPPLAKSDYLMADIERAIHVVKYGQQGEITVNGAAYNSYMAPLGLDDQEVADVLNFILNSWGNSYDQMITVEQVKAVEE